MTGIAHAGAGSWTKGSGLFSPGLGVSVPSIVVDAEGTLYAATNHGAYKRRDGDGGWVSINAGLPDNVPVAQIALDTRGNLYASVGSAYAGGGVYRSGNGGASWTTLNEGLPSGTYVFAFAGAADGNIYAATNMGMFKSSGSVNSWTAVNNGLNSEVIYPGTTTGPASDFGNIYTVAVSGDGNVYAGSIRGIYKSSDGGANWRQVYSTGSSPFSFQTIRALGIDAQGTIYAGSFYLSASRDGGKTWVGTANFQHYVNILASDGKGNIYIGSSDGLFKSSDGGQSAAPVNIGRTFSIYGIAVAPGGVIYAGSGGGTVVAPGGVIYSESSGVGIFRSDVSGTSWAMANDGLAGVDVPISAVAVDGSGIIYAGTPANGLFKSSDSGTTWVLASTGMTGGAVNVLVADSSGNVYAGTAGGIFKSSNGGLLWTAANHGVPTSVSITCLAADSSGNIYAGTITPSSTGPTGTISGAKPGVGLLKSSDGGGSWLPANTGLVTGLVNSLAIDHQNNIYASISTSSGDSIFKSSNGGAGWAASLTGNGAVSALAVDTKDVVYAGTPASIGFSTGGPGNFRPVYSIKRSADGGSSWVPLGSGITPELYGYQYGTTVTALAADASDTIHALVYGHYNNHLYRSADGGNGWSLDDVLNPTAIAADGKGNVYAGTLAGVYQYSQPKPFSINATASGSLLTLNLMANIAVASNDTGKTGNVYALVILVDGSAYMLSDKGWSEYNPFSIAVYATTRLGSHSIPLFNGNLSTATGNLSISALKGAVFYAGYGVDLKDMLNNKKYAAVYTVL